MQGSYAYVIVREKNSHVRIQTEIHFIALFIATVCTLNNYACSLPQWLMSTCLLLRSAFFQPCKSMTGKMMPMKGCSGDLILLPLSAHLCPGLVVEYKQFVGAYGRHSHSKLYHCVILLLCFSLSHHSPHLCIPPVYPFIYTVSMLMNSKESSQTSENQPLFTCQVNSIKVNR